MKNKFTFTFIVLIILITFIFFLLFSSHSPVGKFEYTSSIPVEETSMYMSECGTKEVPYGTLTEVYDPEGNYLFDALCYPRTKNSPYGAPNTASLVGSPILNGWAECNANSDLEGINDGKYIAFDEGTILSRDHFKYLCVSYFENDKMFESWYLCEGVSPLGKDASNSEFAVHADGTPIEINGAQYQCFGDRGPAEWIAVSSPHKTDR